MKTVLFLVNHDIVIYNFRKELVEELLSEGYKVVISSPYGTRIDKLVDLGCYFEEIKIDRHGTNPFKDLMILSQYKKLFKKVNPDIVLTYTIKPNIYGGIVSRFYNIPYISNITGLGTAVEHPGILQKITLFLYKISFKNINTIFFQNKSNMMFFEKNNIYPNKHLLLPGSGVNLSQFSVLEYPRTDKIKFVFISRIMREKGIDQYLEAAEVIKKKYPSTEFHICGFCEEDYEERILRLENKKIVHYHGMVNDIREVLKFTHCTIHPTYYPEGISNVLLESAASGRPVITTDRSGSRETVNNKDTGYLIKEKDTIDLVRTIENFMELSLIEKREMGLRGREKVLREFNRQFVVETYMKKIKEGIVKHDI